MRHTIYYDFNDYYYEYLIDEYYEFHLDIKFNDIMEYLYEKTFNKKFDVMSYRLDKEAKEFVKNLEQEWFKNKVDEIALIQDYNFIDWLKSKYYQTALKMAAKEHVEEEIDSVYSCFSAYNYGYETL